MKTAAKFCMSLLALAVLLACGEQISAEPSGYPGWTEGGTPLQDHWSRPLPPAHWKAADLHPETCGQCHVDKFEEWSSSLHARAFTEGTLGQVAAYEPWRREFCMECHAPLAEQAADFTSKLAASGNGCSGCHVRKGKVFGPPPREPSDLGDSPPHGGFTEASWFSDPAFCAACHQHPKDWAVKGKPLLNTYEEWRASPQAAAGETCQSCHMPDRRHFWRGIHDPATVEKGLTAAVETKGGALRFSITNSGVGHAFPTYTTPKAVLYGVRLDEGGNTLPGTLASLTIHRTVRQTGVDFEELADTRLLPGQAAELVLPWEDSPAIKVWLQVDPDDYYTGHFYDEVRLTMEPGSETDQMLAKAKAWGEANRYRLFEQVVRNPTR